MILEGLKCAESAERSGVYCSSNAAFGQLYAHISSAEAKQFPEHALMFVKSMF
jgi:hypothetical protein